MSREKVIYIPGVSDEPAVQKDVPTQWWHKYGLCVDPRKIDWKGTDYEQRLERLGRRIERLGTVSLMGASGGGKTVLSLFARHPDNVYRVVTISSKVGPYDFKKPARREQYPNLAASSDILPADLEHLSDEMRRRVLCVHPRTDNVVEPVDAVLTDAVEHTVQADGHIPGIARALTVESGVIADFLRAD